MAELDDAELPEFTEEDAVADLGEVSPQVEALQNQLKMVVKKLMTLSAVARKPN